MAVLFRIDTMKGLEGRILGNRTKTIILDFNGTLADDFQLLVDISKKVFKTRGYRIPSDEEIEALRGEPAKEVAKALLGHKKWFYRTLLAVGEGIPLYFQERNNIKPFDGIVNVVNALSKEYKTFILSSNNKETVKYVLDNWNLNYNGVYHSLRWFGLERLFGKGKVLQKILKEKGWEKTPEKLLYIGDEARDADACKKAKVNFLGVTWGYNNETALTNAGVNPEFLVYDPHDIPNKIKLVEARMLMGEKLPTLNPLIKQGELSLSYTNSRHSVDSDKKSV